jgi:ribosomal protein RSM22 (predicted rRNA methylase)
VSLAHPAHRKCTKGRKLSITRTKKKRNLIIVRNKCITIGYEISELSQELESSSLVAERLSLEYSKVARNEVLIEKGLKSGFKLIDTGRVFYVQRDKN